MSEPDLARRNFHQLTLSAVAGLMAGAAHVGQAAAQGNAQPNSQENPAENPRAKPKDVANPMLVEPHVCRGLNTCKGLGAGQQNACVGQGVCATAPPHLCAGHNDCRGLGACYRGDPAKGHEPGYPGENTCKGHGACEVPLKILADPKQRQIWEQARRRFRSLMKDAKGIDIGNPPPLR